MSDIREPNELSIARLNEKKAELEFSLIRSKRRKIEIEWELKKIDENELLTRKAIEEIKNRVEALPTEG